MAQQGLLLLLLSLFLLPGLPSLRGGELKVRLDDLVILLWGLSLWLKQSAKGSLILDTVDLFFPFFGASTLFSTLYGWALSGIVETRDLLELVKLGKYWCAYHIAASLCPPVEVFRKAAFWASIVMFAFSFTQVFNFFSVNSWLSPVYISASQVLNLDPSREWYQRRATATLGNPNDLATMMIVVFWLLETAASERRSKAVWIGSTLVLATLSLTQSRTGLIAFFVGYAAYLLLGPSSVKRRVTGAFVLISLAILVFSGFLPYLAALGKGGLETHSFQLRMQVWTLIMDQVIQSPLVGIGPAKASLSIYVDNEYLLYLYRYGILGLVILLTFYFSIGYWAYRNQHTPYRAVFWILISLLVVNLTNTTFYNQQVMPVLMLLLGGLRSHGKDPAHCQRGKHTYTALA
ncbi:MAG: O-antigen ligase family protein [Betaproteobacteria bacterium]